MSHILQGANAQNLSSVMENSTGDVNSSSTAINPNPYPEAGA